MFTGSWRDFFQHQGTTRGRIIFATPDVRALVEPIERRVNVRVNLPDLSACRQVGGTQTKSVRSSAVREPDASAKN